MHFVKRKKTFDKLICVRAWTFVRQKGDFWSAASDDFNGLGALTGIAGKK